MESQIVKRAKIALLDRPAGTPVAFALFAHCFTCGKDNLAAKRIAQRLTERGIRMRAAAASSAPARK